MENFKHLFHNNFGAVNAIWAIVVLLAVIMVLS